ncbi:MAG: hypothetical protein WA125_00440 [Desulfosporosinus sp.]
MFYHHKHYPARGFLFTLSLLAAFLLGRKSEQYGLTIISRGCGCNPDGDDKQDIRNDPNISPQS